MPSQLLGRMLLAMGVALLGVLAGCSPYTILNAGVPADGYKISPELAYGEHPRQKLDVYSPLGTERPAGVVVFFYGGRWTEGRRGDYRFAGQALASRGYVAVVPDYRLYPDVMFPDFVDDGASALRWVSENIHLYGGDAQRIFLMGHSAGAHIAALLALDGRYLEAAGVPRSTVRGMIGLAGPYAFSPLDFESVRPIFISAKDPEDTRPIAFVDWGDPPLLLLNGTEDKTVYPENTQLLAERARQLELDVRHIAYDDLGHVGIVLALAAPFRGLAPVLNDAAAFIDAR